MTYIVLDENKETGLCLLVRVKNDEISKQDPTPYIVAIGYSYENKDWCWGHYFETLDSAFKDYKCRINHLINALDETIEKDEEE